MCDNHKFRGDGGMFESGSKNLKGTPTKSSTWGISSGFFFHLNPSTKS